MMRPRYNIRQMLRLTTELAVMLSIPIVLLRIGGFWAAIASLILVFVVIPATIGPRLYADFAQLRQRRRALQEERLRFTVEMRTANSERPIALRPHREEPQSGGS